MNNLSMLESLQSMATVDMSDGDAVNRMEAKAKWKACVISKLDHTPQQPGCIKILRFFCDVILTNLLVGRVAPQKFDIRAHHPK